MRSDILDVSGRRQGCYISGSNSLNAAAGAVQISAGTVLRNPEGAVTGSNTYIVPAGRAGIYRISGWCDHQVGAINTRAYMQIFVNGAGGGVLASVENSATAGLTPSAGGFIELSLAAGDAITAKVAHSDAATRTMTWRFMVERVG